MSFDGIGDEIELLYDITFIGCKDTVTPSSRLGSMTIVHHHIRLRKKARDFSRIVHKESFSTPRTSILLEYHPVPRSAVQCVHDLSLLCVCVPCKPV